MSTTCTFDLPLKGEGYYSVRHAEAVSDKEIHHRKEHEGKSSKNHRCAFMHTAPGHFYDLKWL